jgi:phosphopantetheinyl transferase
MRWCIVVHSISFLFSRYMDRQKLQSCEKLSQERRLFSSRQDRHFKHTLRLALVQVIGNALAVNVHDIHATACLSL